MTTVHRHNAKPGLLYYQPGEVTVVLEWDPDVAPPPHAEETNLADS